MNGGLVRIARCGSTQDELHRLAEAGATHGTAVVAAEQEGGRGSRGRAWHSPPGGLWLSVLWRPARLAAVELLSLRAGLAVAATLDALGGLPPCRLKWPNDLLLDDAKAGGLLCEARWTGTEQGWVAIGLGLNVRNDPPADLRLPGTALWRWRPDIAPEALAAPLAAALAGLPSAPVLDAAEQRALVARDWLRGRALAAPGAGVADGLEPDGALRIRRPDGTITRAVAGSVELADAPART